MGGSRGVNPPPPSLGGLDLSGLLPENTVVTPVNSRGVSMRVIKPDQPPVSLFEPPRAGHKFDTGQEEPTLPQMNQM